MANNATPTSSMSSDWALWEKLLNLGHASSIGARGLAIEQAQEAFLNGIIDDPAYQAEALINGVTTPLVASRRSTIECDIKAAPGTDLHIGDIVECLDEQWLVVELYADKVGIINGKMWVCNVSLRFQNHSTDILMRPCVLDDGSYARRSSDPVVYAPSNTYRLYAPIDTDTVKLYLDKRLSFGTTYTDDGELVLEVYKIIGIDNKSKNFGAGSHLMVMTLQRDVYNAVADDIHNLICDVFVPAGDTPSPSQTGSCLIVGKNNVRIGTVLQYTPVFLNAQGTVVEGVAPIWTVTVPTGSGITYEITQSGAVAISVPFVDALIGAEITMGLSDGDEAYGSFVKKVEVIPIG